ncbi:Endochitinase B1 [Golovinomyces cichoracearum]|uniref:chitinase n=1 Tax=Golovinomyces cichoracearum TaxID=62708 RepID=A0A420I793_9PEZI|nr:Endochitinase B1 [Golovinomyces cichoracearum]
MKHLPRHKYLQKYLQKHFQIEEKASSLKGSLKTESKPSSNQFRKKVFSCLGAKMCQDSQYRSVAYFVNWAIYGRKFKPQDLPIENLTHVLYAFANVSPESGEVYLSDLWSDQDIHFDGDSWNETGVNLYGCLKQLNLLKRRNMALKVLLSIGGWTYSANFAGPASTAVGRKKFADSALNLLLNYGFDGLDIDWEYPKSSTEAQNFVALLQICRETMDAYACTLSYEHHFELTVACPAGLNNCSIIDISSMDRYLDFWNLMAYDFAGSFSSATGHHANLFASCSLPASTPFNAKEAVEYYKKNGVCSKKIVLGMPLYGRAFEQTNGLGEPFSGIGEGTWENGIYDYKVLPFPGSEEQCDDEACATFSYDPAKRRLISYDTVQMAEMKAKWIKNESLGGAMWWESSADGNDEKSLIKTVVQELRCLESSQNCIEYPRSRFENLRNAFQNCDKSI